MSGERLSIECPCGARHSGQFSRYQVVTAKCGRSFWALQPDRGGPLKLYAWPGPNLSREQMKQLEADK